MRKIYVNMISHRSDVSTAVSLSDEAIIKNLEAIYSGEKLKKLLLCKNDINQSMNFIDKFCQLIFLCQFDPKGSYIKFYDFHNGVENEISKMHELGWHELDIQKVIHLYSEIKQNTPNKAEFILLDEM